MSEPRFLDLPWPPSTNQLYRSIQVHGRTRVLLAKAARDYHAMVRRRATLDHWPTFSDMDRLEVIIHALPPDRRRRDLDNLLKTVLDSLVRGGLVPDDSQIDKLAIVRGQPVKGGALTIGVWTVTERKQNNLPY